MKEAPVANFSFVFNTELSYEPTTSLQIQVFFPFIVYINVPEHHPTPSTFCILGFDWIHLFAQRLASWPSIISLLNRIILIYYSF